MLIVPSTKHCSRRPSSISLVVPLLEMHVPFTRVFSGGFDVDLFSGILPRFINQREVTLSSRQLRGKKHPTHQAETIFLKPFGRFALRMAFRGWRGVCRPNAFH